MTYQKTRLVWVFYFELKLFIVYYEHMKTEFNRTWLLVAFVFIVNVGIFYYMSQNLEVYVVDSMSTSGSIEGI